MSEIKSYPVIVPTPRNLTPLLKWCVENAPGRFHHWIAGADEAVFSFDDPEVAVLFKLENC